MKASALLIDGWLTDGQAWLAKCAGRGVTDGWLLRSHPSPARRQGIRKEERMAGTCAWPAPTTAPGTGRPARNLGSAAVEASTTVRQTVAASMERQRNTRIVPQRSSPELPAQAVSRLREGRSWRASARNPSETHPHRRRVATFAEWERRHSAGVPLVASGKRARPRRGRFIHAGARALSSEAGR